MFNDIDLITSDPEGIVCPTASRLSCTFSLDIRTLYWWLELGRLSSIEDERGNERLPHQFPPQSVLSARGPSDACGNGPADEATNRSLGVCRSQKGLEYTKHQVSYGAE